MWVTARRSGSSPCVLSTISHLAGRPLLLDVPARPVFTPSLTRQGTRLLFIHGRSAIRESPLCTSHPCSLVPDMSPRRLPGSTPPGPTGCRTTEDPRPPQGPPDTTIGAKLGPGVAGTSCIVCIGPSVIHPWLQRLRFLFLPASVDGAAPGKSPIPPRVYLRNASCHCSSRTSARASPARWHGPTATTVPPRRADDTRLPSSEKAVISWARHEPFKDTSMSRASR